MGNYISIAIDGPSGAGKSTLAKMCAEKFHYLYVDTGAIYRTVGLAAFKAEVSSKDYEGVKSLLPSIDIKMSYNSDGIQTMFLNDVDVTTDIRLPQISIYASDVSAMPDVRAFLLEMQRNLAEHNDVIMDGRDIGTVVLPNAQIKIFLTADPEERAQRRFKELIERGTQTTYKEVLKDIHYRDLNDSTRSNAPLKPAEDSVIVNTTGNTLEESFELLCKIIEEKRTK